MALLSKHPRRFRSGSNARGWSKHCIWRWHGPKEVLDHASIFLAIMFVNRPSAGAKQCHTHLCLFTTSHTPTNTHRTESSVKAAARHRGSASRLLPPPVLPVRSRRSSTKQPSASPGLPIMPHWVSDLFENNRHAIHSPFEPRLRLDRGEPRCRASNHPTHPPQRAILPTNAHTHSHTPLHHHLHRPPVS